MYRASSDQMLNWVVRRQSPGVEVKAERKQEGGTSRVKGGGGAIDICSGLKQYAGGVRRSLAVAGSTSVCAVYYLT